MNISEAIEAVRIGVETLLVHKLSGQSDVEKAVSKALRTIVNDAHQFDEIYRLMQWFLSKHGLRIAEVNSEWRVWRVSGDHASELYRGGVSYVDALKYALTQLEGVSDEHRE